MKQMHAGGAVPVWPSVNRYANNNHISIQLWCDDGPYATLTVNVRGIGDFPVSCSAVDLNNFPGAVALIRETGIGKYTGKVLRSGWCTYPVYDFDLERIREYMPENSGHMPEN